MKYLNIFATGAISFTIAFTAFSSELAFADDAHSAKNLRTLTLVGIGEVKSRPDMAIINLGVVRQAKTARKAVSANNAAMTKIIAAVRSTGLDEKDIQTSGFSVRPLYTHFPRSKNQPQRPPKISGYSVSNNLAVTIRNLKSVGSVLDAVVSAGSNQIGGIRFSIQNPKPLRDEARRKAVKDAIDKAKLYAQAAGVKLGPIQSISEQGGRRPPQPVYRRQFAQGKSLAADSVPIAAGQQSLNMRVNIIWEIQ